MIIGPDQGVRVAAFWPDVATRTNTRVWGLADDAVIFPGLKRIEQIIILSQS